MGAWVPVCMCLSVCRCFQLHRPCIAIEFSIDEHHWGQACSSNIGMQSVYRDRRLFELCTDRCASHVVETILFRMPQLLTEEAATGGAVRTLSRTLLALFLYASCVCVCVVLL